MSRPRHLLKVVGGMLVLGICLAWCLRRERLQYTCTACLRGQPAQCATTSNFYGEIFGKDSSRTRLCEREPGLSGLEKCLDRAPEDFVYRCSSEWVHAYPDLIPTPPLH